MGWPKREVDSSLLSHKKDMALQTRSSKTPAISLPVSGSKCLVLSCVDSCIQRKVGDVADALHGVS